MFTIDLINFVCDSSKLHVYERINTDYVENSLNPDKTPSNSASHPGQNCLTPLINEWGVCYLSSGNGQNIAHAASCLGSEWVDTDDSAPVSPLVHTADDKCRLLSILSARFFKTSLNHKIF